MIVSMVIDMLQTNLRQIGWAYFVFADRCRTDGWRCAVEQKFLSWQLNDQNRSDLMGSQGAWDFSFTHEQDDIQYRIDVIPERMFDGLDLAVARAWLDMDESVSQIEPFSKGSI